MPRYRKPVAVIIHTRVAVDRVNGNPYNTATATVIYRDGSTVARSIPRTYGRHDQAMRDAFAALIADKLVRFADPVFWPRESCEKSGIAFIHIESDVARQRDL